MMNTYRKTRLWQAIRDGSKATPMMKMTLMLLHKGYVVRERVEKKDLKRIIAI